METIDRNKKIHQLFKASTFFALSNTSPPQLIGNVASQSAYVVDVAKGQSTVVRFEEVNLETASFWRTVLIEKTDLLYSDTPALDVTSAVMKSIQKKQYRIIPIIPV